MRSWKVAPGSRTRERKTDTKSYVLHHIQEWMKLRKKDVEKLSEFTSLPTERIQEIIDGDSAEWLEIIALSNALACWPEDLTGQRGGRYYQNIRSKHNMLNPHTRTLMERENDEFTDYSG